MRENLTFDTLLELQDSIALTVSVAGKIATVATIRDVGASALKAQAQIDITAIKISANDELYTIKIQGSNSATFASTIVDLAQMDVGPNEVLVGGVDSVIGRTILPFENVQQGTTYRYIRAYFLIAGTLPSITALVRIGKKQ